MLGYHRKPVEGHITGTPKPMRQLKVQQYAKHGLWQQQISIICGDRHERQPSKVIGNYKTENEKKLEKGSDVASSSLLMQLRGMSLDSCLAFALQ
jgi:hypothetical protein